MTEYDHNRDCLTISSAAGIDNSDQQKWRIVVKRRRRKVKEKGFQSEFVHAF